MVTFTFEIEPLASFVQITDETFIIKLSDGRSLAIPIDWYPRLKYASVQERENWQLLGDGYAIEWIDLDEHIGIEGLLAGRRSGESQRSLNQWLEKRF